MRLVVQLTRGEMTVGGKDLWWESTASQTSSKFIFQVRMLSFGNNFYPKKTEIN